MTRRPTLSLILISGRLAYRADLPNPGTTPLATVDKWDVEPGSDFVATIESIVSRSGPWASRVLVLSAEVWTNVVRLPSAGLKAMPDDELEQALRYEVESLIGLSGDAMAMAYRRLPDAGLEAQFWVTAWPDEPCRTVFEKLSQRGVRSVSFAHPAGLAESTGLSHQRRFEYWPTALAEFSGGRNPSIGIIHGASAVQRWRDEVLLANQTTDVESILWGPGGDACPTSDSVSIDDLSHEEALKKWMLSAGQCHPSEYPCWTLSQHRPVSVGRWALAAVGLALAICAVLLHGNWMRQRRQSIDEQLTAIQQLLSRQESNDAELLRLASEKETLSATTEQVNLQVQLLQYFLDQQVGRLGKLLVWLLELRTDDVLIRELRPHERGMSIIGMSLNSESAPQLANQLRDLAQPYGWRVSLAAQIGAKTLVSGGPWEFEIVLEDIGNKSPGGALWEADRKATRLARETRGERYVR
ncbi:MAG TPA: hypothetical protein PKD54_02675 [Pirellulaceae bacterium]|nr:hypothetical protein [Pirellulaceae bacterium]